MLLFCEAPKAVNRRPCEHFVKISWQLLMRSQAVMWHPDDYFVTTCDNFLTAETSSFCDLLTILWRYSIKSNDFVTVAEPLYDDLETSLWQASVKVQLYKNFMASPQILIWRIGEHTVSRDSTMTTLYTENTRSPICVTGGTIKRQLTVPSVMTMLSNWRSVVHDDVMK